MIDTILGQFSSTFNYTTARGNNVYVTVIYIKNVVNKGIITSKLYGCNDDREKIYITTKINYEKEKIKVDTYRIYLDEEGNDIREEIINKKIYII